MEYLGTLSYSFAAIAFAVLAVLVAMHSRRSSEVLLLNVAIVVNLIWVVVAAYYANKIYSGSVFLEVLEIFRTVAWLVFLQVLLLRGAKNSRALRLLRKLTVATYVLYALLTALVVHYAIDPIGFISETGYQYRAISHLVLAALGIFLVEQLFRHVSLDQRWAVKYLCIGLGGIFTYDFYMYADTLLLRTIDSEIWIARGFVNALMVSFLAISTARIPQFSLNLFVSHRIAFHTTALLAGGLYLLLMGLGGYYIKFYGGAWGSMLQVIFLFAALSILFILIFSGSIRASLRVFLGKHFFHYRYDYRDEWLRITDVLSSKLDSDKLREKALTAIADIVESPRGLLWLRDEDGRYKIAVNWNMPEMYWETLASNDSLIVFLKNTHWIIDVDGYRSDKSAYENLIIPNFLEKLPDVWLIVPLMHQTDLLGFVVLSHARTKDRVDWEVRDLLRTAGRQVSSYLELIDANSALASARQFEAFNRLSAFVVHDLKNIVAQLALIERNAESHKNNPEFIDDAIMTISNATRKMNRLLSQLKMPQIANKNVSQVDLSKVIDQVVTQRSNFDPKPLFEKPDQEIVVLADKDRLASVIEHLVQNGQEATKSDGFVRLRLEVQQGRAHIEIEDNGSGMDDEFLRNKLFKPFVTTKGNAGMGIGVYEAREFLRILGGTIDVKSKLDHGTTFSLTIPICDQRDDIF